tara:strand:- start:771 stop:1142 length:372 start_codon:yes stop_codon:yes gene_type:complete
MSIINGHKTENALLMGIGIAAIGIWIYNYTLDKARVGVSSVDGRGVITNDPIDKGEEIALLKNGDMTKIGKNINHSKGSNAKILEKGDKFILVSTQPIDDNEEVFIDYETNPLGFSTDTRGFQ